MIYSRMNMSLTTGSITIILLLLLASFVLCGCGGGGGGGGGAPPVVINPPPPPPPPPEPCVQTSEGCLTASQYETRINALRQTHSSHAGFTNQWGLARINAHAAWAKLQLEYGVDTAPGAGVTLGAIDSGIDGGHPVFATKSVTETFLLGANDEDGSILSHGTEVASVMIAAPSDRYISRTSSARGVAWGAEIAMFALPVGSGGGNYVPISLSSLSYFDHLTRYPAVIDAVTGWSSGGRSLDFVNVSIGFSGIIDIYEMSDLTTNFGNVINALSQSGSTDKTVFIWAAGNAHGASCNVNDFPSSYRNLCRSGRIDAVSVEILPGLPARIPELRGHHIAVVAIDDTGAIASFSNRCGIAADWCIAAPGEGIRVAIFGPLLGVAGSRGTATYSGTSYSAPMVTAGLGLMKHFFRDQLSNTALVTRLYATADKSGIYANQAIYGQGLMDLDAAVSPLGFTFLALGDQVSDGGISLDSTSLNLGRAFGDGLTHSFANQEIVAFDELGAPFWYSLKSFTETQSSPSIQSRLIKFMRSTDNNREFGIFRPVLGALSTEYSSQNSDRLSLGLMDTPNLVNDGGHLSLLGQAVALNRSISDKLFFSLFSSEGNGDQARVAGMEFVSQSLKSPITFRSGVVAERRSLLRSSASGAFGRVSGNSAFVGLEGSLKVGSWQLSAGAEVGTVTADIDESLLSIKSPLTTSAFALRAGKRLNERDTLKFAFSQPVRIESGRAEYTIPVGRTVEGDVLKSFNSVNLEPSGRQIDLSALWHRSIPSGSGDFRLAASLSFYPGHSVTADPKISVLAGWRLGF